MREISRCVIIVSILYSALQVCLLLGITDCSSSISIPLTETRNGTVELKHSDILYCGLWRDNGFSIYALRTHWYLCAVHTGLCVSNTRSPCSEYLCRYMLFEIVIISRCPHMRVLCLLKRMVSYVIRPAAIHYL